MPRSDIRAHPGAAGRAYRAMLHLLPRPFRDRFGPDLESLFLERLADARGWRARCGIWVDAAGDLLIHGAAERMANRGFRRRRVAGLHAGPGRVAAPPLRHPPQGRAGMRPFLQDLRFGARTLLRRPGFSAPVVATLGLGVGLAATMAVVAHAILVRPLPYPEPDRLVLLGERTDDGRVLPASYLNFADWRAGATAFSAMAAAAGLNVTAVGGLEPARAPALFVTADFFRVAGVAPARGRAILAGENAPGAAPVAVVGHDFWVRTLGATEDLEAATLAIQDLMGRVESYRVVGVLPPGFDLGGQADVYLPLERAVPWNVRGNHVVRVLGRLAAGATLDDARQDLARVHAAILAEYADETEAMAVTVQPLHEEVVGAVRTPVLLLLVAAGFLLLVAFINVGGALLARGVARRHELGVRAALGATRGRLVRQLATESLLLGAGGLVLGVLLARALLLAVGRIDPSVLPRLAEVGPGGAGLALAAVALTLVGLPVFGVLTAAIGTRDSGDRGLRTRDRGFRGERAAWRVLLSAELAVALTLLVTAGVLARSLWRIATEDTGFRSDGVVTAQVNLPPHTYSGSEALLGWFDGALRELRATPGIRSAGLVNLLPVPGGSNVGGPVALESGEASDVVAQYRVADGGYFEAMSIRLLRGRLFDERDRAGAPHAAVVNQTLAQRLWPGLDPLGRRFHLGGMDPYREDWLTVVGVVAEARPWTVARGARPTYYVSHRQRPAFLGFTGGTLVARGDDPTRVAGLLRERLAALDPEVPLRIETLDRRLAAGTADRRFVATVLALFAGLALLLAGVGIWGVVSFVVSRRTRETGIRLALGARPAQVRRGLQSEALLPVLVGLATGAAAASALTRLVRSLLFGVDPLDPAAFAAAAVLLAASAWLASWIPARRSTRVDPAATLRSE